MWLLVIDPLSLARTGPLVLCLWEFGRAQLYPANRGGVRLWACGNNVEVSMLVSTLISALVCLHTSQLKWELWDIIIFLKELTHITLQNHKVTRLGTFDAAVGWCDPILALVVHLHRCREVALYVQFVYHHTREESWQEVLFLIGRTSHPSIPILSEIA